MPETTGTRCDRTARLTSGRKARERLTRSKLGELRLDGKRSDPIDHLLAANDGRLERLLPLKYSRMAVSPFSFFRGAVSIMAADLASEPNTGLHVQLCGDAHLENLGWFETPDGRIVFDINDFDETLEGPWEWDVKRMATSMVLAGWESGHGRSACQLAVEQFVQAYCGCTEDLADTPILVAARYQIHRLVASAPVGLAFKQAKRASPLDLLRKYTATNGRGQPVFREIPKVLWRVTGDERKAVMHGVAGYIESLAADRQHLFDFFRPLDVAFKVVGTGSVGLHDYVVLMEGNGPKDPLFLQVKQEVASAYSRHLKHERHPHQGRRVAEGQRKMQLISDLLLGWTNVNGHDYLVRQLNDHKGKIEVDNLRGEGLRELGIIAGHLLARAHARSGDPLVVRGYIGAPEKVIDSITRYAWKYAERTQADYKLFQKAIEAGGLPTVAA